MSAAVRQHSYTIRNQGFNVIKNMKAKYNIISLILPNKLLFSQTI